MFLFSLFGRKAIFIKEVNLVPRECEGRIYVNPIRVCLGSCEGDCNNECTKSGYKGGSCTVESRFMYPMCCCV